MSPPTEKTLQTLLFYTIYFVVCFVLEMIMPTGGHAPGLGLMFLIVLPVIVFFLLIVNIAKLLQSKKEYRFSVVIHTVFLLAVLTVIIYYNNH